MRAVEFLGEGEQRLAGLAAGVDGEMFELLDGQLVERGGLRGLAARGKQAGWPAPGADWLPDLSVGLAGTG